MNSINIGLLLLLAVIGNHMVYSCDIIVHVQSNTTKKFQAQVVAPNGKKSEKWQFSKPREKNTFQQKASECGIKDWEITTFDGNKPVNTVKVSLNGIGRVTYTVGDDLKAVQSDRHGAMCSGQCAPLGTQPSSRSRSNSPVKSTDD
ncbi:unnamed protein product [Enterobius vermicularis]|uniref:I-set domain-containing protein n=1 Tax=Enterobius vermicularis TaxID=51028 RepID=A0A0N4VN90_ENTVE|nr:unnamed protein product [Enterobius vermicularis]